MKRVILLLGLVSIMTLIPFYSFASASITPGSTRSATRDSLSFENGSFKMQDDGGIIFVKSDGTIAYDEWISIEVHEKEYRYYFGANGKLVE